MEIKFGRINKIYFIEDCAFEFLVWLECDIEWGKVEIDLDDYFWVDEKGIIYNEDTGEAVGILVRVKGAINE